VIDGMAYMAMWRERAASMERSGEFEIRFESDPGIWDEDPANIEEELASEPGMGEVHILDDMLSFYRVVNGFYLRWISDIEADTDMKAVARGYAHIEHLSYLYEPAERREREKRDIPYSSLYEDYRVFDWIGSGNVVALRFYRDCQEPEFYYHVQKTDAYHLMTLDFSGYMDLLLESRGLLFWQEFFIADPQARIAPDWAEWFHANLARLFPDADASRFRR